MLLIETATPILFAVDGRDAVLVTLGGAIIAGIGKLAEFLWGWVTQNRADKKEEVSKMEAHLDSRIKRLELELARFERRNGRLNRRVRELENSKTQMSAYIQNCCRNNDTAPFVEIPLPPDESEDDEPLSMGGTDTKPSLSPKEGGK